MSKYIYKVISIDEIFKIESFINERSSFDIEKDYSTNTSFASAYFMHKVLNHYAEEGWEFDRIQSLSETSLENINQFSKNYGLMSKMAGHFLSSQGHKSLPSKSDIFIFKKYLSEEQIRLTKEKRELEDKIKSDLIKPLDSEHPRVKEVERNAMSAVSKLQRNGYELVSKEISLTTERWVLKSQLDGTTFDMKSLKELTDFASNFK